jgi:tRNA nucleotidyltransferase (CCA-adding enzyme)
MNKYIKVDGSNLIIDVFFTFQKSKFDGTEIFLEDTEIIKHKINNKSISDEYGNYIFEYVSGVITEVATDLVAGYKKKKKEELESIFKNNWLDTTRTMAEIKTKWATLKSNASSWTTIEDIDIAYDSAIAWLGL